RAGGAAGVAVAFAARHRQRRALLRRPRAGAAGFAALARRPLRGAEHLRPAGMEPGANQRQLRPRDAGPVARLGPRRRADRKSGSSYRIWAEGGPEISAAASLSAGSVAGVAGESGLAGTARGSC